MQYNYKFENIYHKEYPKEDLYTWYVSTTIYRLGEVIGRRWKVVKILNWDDKEKRWR